MNGPIRWIREDAALAEWVARAPAGSLGVDCEADSLHHYPEKVCLVQISGGGEDLLLDPLGGLDLAPLRPLFAARDREKVLHGADYDLRMLDREWGLAFGGLFDTVVAARLAGERAYGLSALLERHLGVCLDKRFQRADWSRRPLPAEMERYAATDTRHLSELADRLRERLGALGRLGWCEEELRRMESIRWVEPDLETAWTRVKGTGALTPREAAVLREVHRLRESIARERDRPPFRVFGDATLLALARSRPAALGALEGVPGFPRRWPADRSRRFLEAIARAEALPEGDLPAMRREVRARPSADTERRLRALRDARDRVGSALDLDPSLIAPRATLEAAVEREGRGEDPFADPRWRRWQVELMRPAFATRG